VPHTPTDYFLHKDGTLSMHKPADKTASLTFTYDPKDPAPSLGGNYAIGTKSGPLDQRPAKDRKDIVRFVSAPLTGAGMGSEPETVTPETTVDGPGASPGPAPGAAEQLWRAWQSFWSMFSRTGRQLIDSLQQSFEAPAQPPARQPDAQGARPTIAVTWNRWLISSRRNV